MFVIINPTKGPWWATPGECNVVGDDPHTYPTIEEAEEDRVKYAEEYSNPQLKVYALVKPETLKELMEIAAKALPGKVFEL